MYGAFIVKYINAGTYEIVWILPSKVILISVKAAHYGLSFHYLKILKTCLNIPSFQIAFLNGNKL